jgi:ribosomal protein S18 acetylase RimI-like enzyme
MDTQEDIQYEEVTEYTPAVAAAVRRLVSQLDENFQPLTDEDIKNIIHSPATHLIVAVIPHADEIVGMMTLVTYRIPYKMKGWIEDVVVDEAHRKKGIGRTLLEEGIKRAAALNVKTLDLTSRPTRESANALYLHLGFEKRDTNVYRKSLE